MMDNAQLAELKPFIQQAARELGFDKVGFARPEFLDREGDDLRRWLEEGRHGAMDWIARRQAERHDIEAYYPPVKTVVALAMNYYAPPEGTATGHPSLPASSGQHSTISDQPQSASCGSAATATATATSSPRWSNYAWGDDYHRLIKKRLKALLKAVAGAYPNVHGIACVDTSPVMEKVWAQRAGLGWPGKHTNLITREAGSWVFLGELLLDVALAPDPPFEDDLCGSCTACLDACPTGALDRPYQIDARRCISYLTIEHRGAFSEEQAQMLGGWLYGCDICQEVCPWNIKFAQPSPEPAFMPREFITTYDWADWAELSRERWDDLLRGSAARRAGYEGLMRNARAQRTVKV